MESRGTVKAVVHSNLPDWQNSGLALAPGQIAHMHVESEKDGVWYVIDPNVVGPLGPEGYKGHIAKDTYLQPGVCEGALLVKYGGGIVEAFTDRDKDIGIPGKIEFVANDEPSPQEPNHQGYADNWGKLTVIITVS